MVSKNIPLPISRQITKTADTDDAYSLISKANTPMERAYADYVNKMKSLANQARMNIVSTGKIAYSASAKAAYQPEVKSLMSKLDAVLLNAPRERRAQLMANVDVAKKKQKDPNMKPGDIKKASQQALTKNRNAVGAKCNPIVITDKEWEAMQAGAISENVLTKILNNTDVDNLRQRATPRSTTSLSDTKVAKIKAMNASNYSLSEIAKSISVSTTTVSNYLKGVN